MTDFRDLTEAEREQVMLFETVLAFVNVQRHRDPDGPTKLPEPLYHWARGHEVRNVNWREVHGGLHDDG